ncbi:MAG: biotin/lipoyl-binding protein, partial [Rubrimonas sp.]
MRYLKGALFAFAALSAASAMAQQGGPVPVTVVTLQAQDVTLTATLPGRVVASATAEVRPQVNGIIIERLFEEGADVAPGDPLYRIDDAAYRAALAAAQAQVRQAEAAFRAAER